MGILVLLLGLGALGYGIFQHFKGKRILAAPFKRTGELGLNPISTDPKGAMSTEGAVIAPATPLLAPCSLQPCLAYEVTIERLYEEYETTSEGTKSSKGSDRLETLQNGTEFKLDDGSGAFSVDFSKGVDFDGFIESYKKEIGGSNGSSNVQFGELHFDVPVNRDSKKVTLGFRATEKHVPVQGKLFVLGKLEGAKLVKPGWRSLLASAKGRDGLLGSIQKHKKYSFIGGGIASGVGLILALFVGSSQCDSKFENELASCSDTVKKRDGLSYQWQVSNPGEYEVVLSTDNSKFEPELTLKNEDGEVVAESSNKNGKKTRLVSKLTEGKYRLIVQQALGPVSKSGFEFTLSAKNVQEDAPKAKIKEDESEKIEESPPEPVAVEEAPDTDAEAPAEAPTPKRAAIFEKLAALTSGGPFDYQFTDFECDTPKRCVLAFKATDHADSDSQFLGEIIVPDIQSRMDYSTVLQAIERWESLSKEKKKARSLKLKQKAGSKNDTRWSEYLPKLEELCKSAWCAGYFQYRFKKLECENETQCVLAVEAKDSDGVKYSALLQISEVKPLNDPQWAVAFQKALTRWENLPKGMKMRASTASAKESMRR